MIDELVQTNEVVNPIFIDGVWFEIYTIEDLENVREKKSIDYLIFFLSAFPLSNHVVASEIALCTSFFSNEDNSL